MKYISPEDQPAVVRDMARVIVRGFSPLALILFGSRARGDADEFSDADFVVVTDRAEDPAAVEREILRAVARFGMQTHVFVRSPDAFQREALVPGAMMWPAAREGVLLHEWPGWRERHPVDPDPAADLARVLDREYRAKALDYLDRARSQLALGALMRCRDLCLFAAIAALKGLHAVHGAHPPRDVDLAFQFRRAATLVPELAPLRAGAEALHDAAPQTEPEARAALDTATALVRAALDLYPLEN